MFKFHFHAQEKNQIVTRSGLLSALCARSWSVLSRNDDEWKHLSSSFLSPTCNLFQNEAMEVPWCPFLWSKNYGFISFLDSPMNSLREPADFVSVFILRINQMWGCTYIKLAKSNLRNRTNKNFSWNCCWDEAFLRITEKWSQIKCPLQLYWFWSNMALFPHSVTIELGVHKPFKCVLQLEMYVYCFPGRPRTFIRFL